MKSFKKSIALLVAVSMIVGCVIGGTLAWLTATSSDVVNTFTTSDISVTLSETTGNTYKMVPGCTITKDPKVTVVAGSEDCYLFVKVEELNQLDSYIVYSVNTSQNEWTKGDGSSIPANVYYRKVAKANATQEFSVLGAGNYVYKNVTYTWNANQVLTKPEVTKEMMTAAKTTQPTLTFTAYASQLYKSDGVEFEAAEAWANAQPSSGGTSATE